MIRPQPEGAIGGADLHIADLAETQLGGSEVNPSVLALRNEPYRRMLIGRGVPVAAQGQRLSPSGLCRLRTVLAVEDIDVVHSHGYEGDYVGVFLSRRPWGRRQLPLVITSHGLVRTSPALRAKTWLDIRCFGMATRVISTSRPDAQRLARQIGLERVHYVPNGIAISVASESHEEARHRLHCEFGFPREAQVVAFVGRLAPEKRPDLFVEACTKIASQADNVGFLVVGTGPEQEHIDEAARVAGIRSRLRFAGLRWDVPDLLLGVDVLLCTSDTEGTPRAVLEAMARGAVVVATSVGGVPDLVRHDQEALLVAPDDAAATAAATMRIVEEPGLALRLRTQARRRVESHYTVEQMATAVEHVYRAALVES